MSRWRPVTGFEGQYEISFDGMVRSLDRVVVMKNRWGGFTERKHPGKQLRLFRDKRGYLQVGLKRNDKIHNKRVHCLVAEAFLVKPEWADRVNHRDSNRWHNVVSNLEWSNASDNAKHYFDQPHAKKWSRHP
jgi:hypothetical protein